MFILLISHLFFSWRAFLRAFFIQKSVVILLQITVNYREYEVEIFYQGYTKEK